LTSCWFRDRYIYDNEHENMTNIRARAKCRFHQDEILPEGEAYISASQRRNVDLPPRCLLKPQTKDADSTHPMGVRMGKTIHLTHLLQTRDVRYVTWSVLANYYLIISLCYSFDYASENPASRFGSKPRAAAGAKTNSAATPRLWDCA
jgi:hypothetical protein